MAEANGGAALVSVNNFHTVQAPINSPRTLEACLRSGFDPKVRRTTIHHTHRACSPAAGGMPLRTRPARRPLRLRV